MYNESFAEKIVAKLQELMPDKVIMLKDVVNNNSIIEHGIGIGTPGTVIAPILHIDKYMTDKSLFNNDFYFAIVVGCILNEYEAFEKDLKSKAENNLNLLDFESIKDKIYFSLVNTDNNELLLNDVPHRSFLDLSITYNISIHANEDQGKISGIIMNTLFENWEGITEEDLYNAALVNTPKLFPFIHMNTADVIRKHVQSTKQFIEDYKIAEEESGSQLIILTNNCNKTGSHVLLYSDYIREVMQEYGTTKAYILPGSIHEVTLLLEDPSNMIYNPVELLEIVQETNSKNTTPEEILSNSVYVITLDEDVSIAANSKGWSGEWEL